jgi:malonyl-ACP O-methyltransferase BioC
MKFSSAATYDAAASVQHACFDTLTSFISTLSPTRILDLGCGTGTTTIQLTQLFPSAHITAIDHSDDMISFARHHNTHPHITYCVEDISTYTPELEFDLIVSNAAFQWVDHASSVMDRYMRYLTDTGTLAISYFGPETFRDLRDVLNAVSITAPLAADSFINISQENVVKQDYITLLFPSFLGLLKHIKQTGTRTTNASLFLTPGKARECEATFITLFSHVKLTYHALFCVRKKS